MRKNPFLVAAGILADKPCNTHKCCLAGFLNHRPKALLTMNTIQVPRYNLNMIDIMTIQATIIDGNY